MTMGGQMGHKPWVLSGVAGGAGKGELEWSWVVPHPPVPHPAFPPHHPRHGFSSSCSSGEGKATAAAYSAGATAKCLPLGDIEEVTSILAATNQCFSGCLTYVGGKEKNMTFLPSPPQQ